ncbi:MAG: restriction endonuclease subunit S [Burkholderiales bacterium]|jgi:type I restriction enzyme S subunit
MSWLPKQLGEILEQSGRHRAGDQDLPVLSITMKHGLVDQADKFKKRVASSDTSNYRVAYKNELVVGFPIDEGVLGFQTKYPAGIVSPAYDIWKLRSEVDSHIPYLERYLRSAPARGSYATRMQGAVARRRSLTKTDFLNLEIPFPPLDDQIRIAQLLGKVEGLIAQRKQHLQQLDDLLKSVFLKMFGDPVKNDRQWKTQPFSQVGRFFSGGTPSKSRDDYWVGDYPWVSPKDMKTPRIFDSEDHISDRVFGETSLKRIAPGHLLIVVRGMILAHSFPVAINMVDVAINQDMKAIKINDSLRVDYVFHCLSALKRQILKLITTAGHGTKKFDSDVMEKLLVPVPPPERQDDFILIADKVEALKSRYQQSLTDLEALYGVLSQRAFKGELDVSRVALPAAPIEGESPVAAAMPAPITTPVIKLPETDLLLPALQDRAKLAPLLRFWLEAYTEQLGDMAFSVDQFMQEVETRAEEAFPDREFELGADAYELIKAWVFDVLRSGRLEQVYPNKDDDIRVAVRKPRAVAEG